MRVKTMLLGGTVLAALALAGAWIMLHPAPMSVADLKENGAYLYDEPLQIGDFALADHRGGDFTPEFLQDQWTLVFFGFTSCPDICPITMATLKQFYHLLREEGLAEEVRVVMASVDPQRDTLEALDNYVSFFDPDFVGVTGDYARIYSFARRLNAAFSYQWLDEENYLVNHSGEIMLINPEGDYHGFFQAPHEPLRMMENFRSIVARWN